MNTTDMRIPSNRVRDIERYMHTELDAQYGEEEVRAFVGMLFEAFLGWDRAHLLLHREGTIDQSDLLRFHWAVEDLRRWRPIQHIIGYTDFCGCRIRVTPDVLVPRPETEEMVSWLCARRAACVPDSILDLCTGSGCIAIALKKAFPEAVVTAVDISLAALALARRNAEENGTAVDFVEADVLDPAQLSINVSRTPANCQFSIIVSNPPYVRESERAVMAANVLDYDPAIALFVPDDDPLRFYRAISAFAAGHLAPQGLLALEINEALAAETCALLQSQGFSTEVREDFRGKPRMVTATLSGQ